MKKFIYEYVGNGMYTFQIITYCDIECNLGTITLSHIYIN